MVTVSVSVLYIGIAVLFTTGIAHDATEVKSLILDLLEVRLAIDDVVEIITDLTNRRDNEVTAKYSGVKLVKELLKNHQLKSDIMDIKTVFDDQKYKLERPIEILTITTFLDIDREIWQMLNKFADPGSNFQNEPQLVVPILFPLSKFVQSLQNIIKSNANQSDDQNYQDLLENSIVPCNLADTIAAYFKPTLFNRWSKIEILFTDYGKNEWYSRMHQIFKDPFNPSGFTKNDIKLSNCVTSKQLNRIMSKCYPDPGDFGPNIFYDYKNLACSHYFKDLSRIKDNSVVESDYYYGGRDGTCSTDYFARFRYGLESQFVKAYKEVLPFCSIAIHVRNKTSTGFGWLTVNVIAALPEFGERIFDTYVKLIVYYSDHVRHYITKVIEKANGWTQIGETFLFDKAFKNTTVKLQLWHYNKYKSDEQLYEENTTISSMTNRIIFRSSTSKTSSKVLMASLWRDDYVDDNFFFASNAISK